MEILYKMYVHAACTQYVLNTPTSYILYLLRNAHIGLIEGSGFVTVSNVCKSELKKTHIKSALIYELESFIEERKIITVPTNIIKYIIP